MIFIKERKYFVTAYKTLEDFHLIKLQMIYLLQTLVKNHGKKLIGTLGKIQKKQTLDGILQKEIIVLIKKLSVIPLG